MADGHADAVEVSFSAQAAAFEDQRINSAFATGTEWIFERLALKSDQLLLDVAAGTGHAARLLAPGVGMVVAVDVTVAMLEAGKLAAERSGLRNVLFMRGDATALPFPVASFDVVVSRFAVHHFEDPASQLAEMVRCLRPRGQLVVADLVAGDDPVVAKTQNELERMRDPSHTTLLSSRELGDALAQAGSAVIAADSREVQRPLAPWLAQTQATDAVAGQITQRLREEIDGGPLTGLRPRDRDGELWFVQRFTSVTAAKP